MIQSRAPEPIAFHQPIRPQIFLRMAWWANPFAYIAINTVVATIPALARRFDLSTTQSGLFGSIWLFARLATVYLQRKRATVAKSPRR